MGPYQIAVLVGSLRRESFNRKLASAIAELAPADFVFQQLQIDDLPLYNQDDDAGQAASVKRLKTELTEAHGLLFVTPEYNRSVPGVLKNAIDHASRPYGQSAWAGKPGGVMGVSVGAIGTALAQQHLKQQHRAAQHHQHFAAEFPNRVELYIADAAQHEHQQRLQKHI